jgi:hypothetical protein
MKRRREGAVRDQSDSPFSAILTRLCESSGALAAALVDAEGETVDYAGVLEPYEIKVVAAEWRLVLAVTQGSALPGFRHVSGLTIRARRRSYVIESMPDGYAIDLPVGRAALRWARVRVRTPPGSRPKRRPDAIWISESWSPITILGRYQARDLSHSELGYLARLASGAEVFLVREALGCWFIDDVGALI